MPSPITTSVTYSLRAATNKNADIINSIEALIVAVLDGTVGEPVWVAEDLTLGTTIDLVQAIINAIVNAGDNVNSAIDRVELLVANVKLVTIGDDVNALVYDDVIVAAADVAEIFVGEENVDAVNALENLFSSIIDGTIGEPVYNEQYTAGALIDDVQNIIGAFIDLGDDVNAAIDEIEELLNTVRLTNANEDIDAIELDFVVETVTPVIAAISRALNP